MASIVLKRQRWNEDDNKEQQNLNKYKSNNYDNRYVFLPLTILPPSSQKESNCLSDLSKKTRSLTHLVYILKIAIQRSVNFALEFPGRKGSKPKNKKFINHLKKGLKTYLAFTTFITFNTINHHRLIREHLKSHLFFSHCQSLGINFVISSSIVWDFS